ncbi:MAG: response regulator transcription factor [Atopobiaceae bacterium]|nr:response regulator transcription factor [Atopobiaceae bacterium]
MSISKPVILIVEDDPAVRNLIVTTLETRGYDHSIASSGTEALHLASDENPDIMILDLGLPDIDGIEVIKRVRTWSPMPIIIVSARNEDADKIAALDAGADDYLTKPFSIDELLARLRVTQRRLATLSDTAVSKDSIFVNGDLTIDFDASIAKLNGEELHLTPIEFRLITLLSKNVDKVLTHRFILQEIWGSDADDELPSLRVFMRSLRKKIEADPSHPRYIQTHVGVGYRMLRV